MTITYGVVILSLAICCCFKSTTCVTLLPYGVDHPNDIDLFATDESTLKVSTLQPFIFFGTSYTNIWIASNGFIGFGDYTECCYPDLAHSNPVIAPLWDDWEPGILYYRQTTTDEADLVAASAYVRSIYAGFSTFQATWVLVATWSYFILWWTGNVFATFQAILTSDGSNVFAVFLYDRIDGVSEATVTVDAGDGTNYYILCGGVTGAMKDLPLMKQTCTSEPGIFVFRIDSVNPSQANYECTSTLISTGDPKGSYFCRWSDPSETLLDMTFILTKPHTCGITAWDTQKYENGEVPSIADPKCKVLYTEDPSSLTIRIDTAAATPPCGIHAVDMYGGMRTFDLTVRAYYDLRFETAQDLIYQFSCSTNTALPASAELYKQFSGIEIDPLPTVSRTLQLMLTAPDNGDVLTEVQIGQLFRLRLVYDNTVNNIEPYGVYVENCFVADTVNFDTKTFQFIKDGCAVEQNPERPWYISRSFKQTSLSAAGLFISDSGVIYGAKFTTQDKIFFQCVVNFCYFVASVPNKCTDSCTGGSMRRKRDSNMADAKPRTVYTSVIITALEGNDAVLADSTSQQEDNECVDKLCVFLTFGTIGSIILLNTIVASVLFQKVSNKKT